MSFDLWSFVVGLLLGVVSTAERDTALAGAARVLGFVIAGATLTWVVLR